MSGRTCLHSLVSRWSLTFPNGSSFAAPRVFLRVAGSDCPVRKPLATGFLAVLFNFSLLLQRCGQVKRMHKPLTVSCCQGCLFWPAPVRPVESVNLFSLGRKVISGRSYWASRLMLTLRDSHLEGDLEGRANKCLNKCLKFRRVNLKISDKKLFTI